MKSVGGLKTVYPQFGTSVVKGKKGGHEFACVSRGKSK